MTTGPQHYIEAERLIEEANHVGHTDPQRGDGMIAAAQVHATLALAAATALGHREISDDEDSYNISVLPSDDYQAWWRAASEGPGARQRRREAERAEEAPDWLTSRIETSTAEWYAASKKAGCTGTGYDAERDTIEHKGVLPCPVHPGL